MIEWSLANLWQLVTIFPINFSMMNSTRIWWIGFEFFFMRFATVVCESMWCLHCRYFLYEKVLSFNSCINTSRSLLLPLLRSNCDINKDFFQFEKQYRFLWNMSFAKLKFEHSFVNGHRNKYEKKLQTSRTINYNYWTYDTTILI